MFMKVFTIKADAIEFANLVRGILSVRYDWDMFRNEMIEEYVVKY